MGWSFYWDAGLTTEVDEFEATGYPTSVFAFWVGTDVAGRKIRAKSAPGVDNLTLAPADSDPGTGHEMSAVRLALTSGGLATASWGATLDLGVTQITSAAPLEVWAEVRDQLGQVGESTELSLALCQVEESAL